MCCQSVRDGCVKFGANVREEWLRIMTVEVCCGALDALSHTPTASKQFCFVQTAFPSPFFQHCKTWGVWCPVSVCRHENMCCNSPLSTLTLYLSRVRVNE